MCWVMMSLQCSVLDALKLKGLPLNRDMCGGFLLALSALFNDSSISFLLTASVQSKQKKKKQKKNRTVLAKLF